MKAAAKRSVGTALKAVAHGWDRVRSIEPGVTLLVYHRIGGRTNTQIDLPRSVFADQVAELSEQQRVVSLDDAVEMLASGADLHHRPVVFTFDDGTSDWVDEALPILHDHGAPATFYVATNHVDQQIAFPGEARPITWAALTELASSPLMTIGSHTHTHLLLDRVGESDAAQELDRSIEMLGDKLGVKAEHFAYPKGLLGSPGARSAVAERFRTASVAGGRPNRPGSFDPLRLWRSSVQTADGMRWFRAKARGGLELEDRAREFANRRRYAELTR